MAATRTYKRGKPRSADDLRARFLDLPTNDRGCWEWDACTRNGYGSTSFGNSQWYTHRLSYTLFVDDIPDALCVCHHCDNRRCCNPSHFFLGTREDNMRDALAKGRHAWSKGNLVYHGEEHGRAKLTEAQVREIRQLADDGWVQQDIADAYGVEQTTVSGIKLRKRWKELP